MELNSELEVAMGAHTVHVGRDPNNMALEVVVVAAGSATTTGARGVREDRRNRRNVPVIVAHVAGDSAWLLGPEQDAVLIGPLPVEQARGALDQALSEPNATRAVRSISTAIEQVQRGGRVGLENRRLFATYYLTQVAPEADNWDDLATQGAELRGLRGESLIGALGYSSKQGSAHTLLLSGGEGPANTLAVLLRDDEAFDRPSQRFATSPISQARRDAATHKADWIILLRGPEIRLYPAESGVAIGDGPQSDTYLGLTLSLIDDDTSAYLPLLFSADALAHDGTITQVVAASQQFAAALSRELRERIYEHAVPPLAIAVAEQLSDRAGVDDLEIAYRCTLRILFRILFQAFAEDAGMLPYEINEAYRGNSLNQWAQRIVNDPEIDRKFSPKATSIWADLAQIWTAIADGDDLLGIPAYNGGLFSAGDSNVLGELINLLQVDNRTMGTVLTAVLTRKDLEDGSPVAVDFRAIEVREFGTIYEGLLESGISRAEQDLVETGKGEIRPADPDVKGELIPAGTVYFHNKSGDRKNTGSYFTPKFAVEHLLERALDPTLEEHLDEIAGLISTGDNATAAERFFDFRVADLAMGSGHFLVAAIDHIERQMEAFLEQHPIPAVMDELGRLHDAAVRHLGEAASAYDIEPSMLLRRQIARRCIYGLDINETAVELAKVAVWVKTFVPGLPMSNLDRNLVCKNSLTGIGSIDEAIDALAPNRQPGATSLFRQEIVAALDEARVGLLNASRLDEASIAEYSDAVEMRRQAMNAAAPAAALLDAAVAKRLDLVDPSIENRDSLVAAAQQPDVKEGLAAIQPAHFPLLFPEVFLAQPAGFDVILGNPPWDEVTVERHGWWALRFPGVRGLKADDMELEIRRLEAERSDLQQELEAEVRSTENYRNVIRRGPYPGIGTGDVDLYKAFAWRFWHQLRSGGRMGTVFPRGVLSAKGSTDWRQEVLSAGSIEDAVVLTNGSEWVFDGVDQRYTVVLIVASPGSQAPVGFAGPYYDRLAFDHRLATPPVDREKFLDWSDALQFPAVPTDESGVILRQLKSHPRFSRAFDFDLSRPNRELDATNDKVGTKSKTSLFVAGSTATSGTLPVWAGASFNLWEPNAGDPYGWAEPGHLRSHLLAKTQKGTRSVKSAFHGLSVESVDDLPISRARIAFRDVARATDSRTAIFSLIPPDTALVNNAPYLVRRAGDEADEAYLLGIACSLPFDWYARRWVELHLNFFILEHFPVPRPERSHPLRQRMVSLAGRLAAADDRFADWAKAVDVPMGTLTDETDSTGRFDAICELDALSSLLYGLSPDQVSHIFETFHRGWSTDSPDNDTLYNYNKRLERVLDHFESWKPRA